MYDSMNYPQGVTYPTAKTPAIGKPASITNTLIDEDELAKIVYWQAIETQRIQTAHINAQIAELDGNWSEVLRG